MDEKLLKSVVELIDETLMEIEDLKKSNRFEASEIKIEGAGENQIDGKPVNGSIGKSEEDKKKEEDEEKKKKEEMDKSDDEDADDVEDEDEEDDKDEDKNPVEKSIQIEESLKKSREEMESLMKSYVDERISPIESKIDSLVNLIKELGDSPLPQRGSTYRNVKPLNKSLEEPEALTKSQVCNKLMDLKKSGVSVNTEDIINAELGGPAELNKIVQKYNLK